MTEFGLHLVGLGDINRDDDVIKSIDLIFTRWQ
jgi:hypothetical protein